MKKGFLKKASGVSNVTPQAIVPAQSAAAAAAHVRFDFSQAPSTCILPLELMNQILEEVFATKGPELEYSIAALRQTSKLLHHLLTPHFYKVIQVRDRSTVPGLIAGLQAQPELCETTRAVWWEQKADAWSLRKHPIKSEQPYLVKFDNVDEVAYISTHSFEAAPQGFPVGVHYSLRDAGAWCEPVSFLRPNEPVDEVQQTPTLHVEWTGEKESRSGYWEAEYRKADEWKEANPGQPEPEFGHYPFKLDAQPKRAIWACHLVVPALREQDFYVYELPRTVTHLTITLYSHARLDNERYPYRFFKRLLDPRRMPLLEYLTVRISKYGEGEKGMYNGDAEGPYGEEMNRTADVETAMMDCEDLRTTLEEWESPSTPQATLYEDIRRYTLQQWQERAHGTGKGPWKEPLTKVVRPQVVGGWDEDWETSDPWSYPQDADFRCNRPSLAQLQREWEEAHQM